MAVAVCETGSAYVYAERAAEWLRAFHPDIMVTVNVENALLVSNGRDERALRLIWRSALANEVLLARGQSERGSVIGALVG